MLLIYSGLELEAIRFHKNQIYQSAKKFLLKLL